MDQYRSIPKYSVVVDKPKRFGFAGVLSYTLLSSSLNWTIFNLCQKKNYIILNFNYPMINTFLVIFLNQKIGSILNPIHKVSLSIFEFKFYSTINIPLKF